MANQWLFGGGSWLSILMWQPASIWRKPAKSAAMALAIQLAGESGNGYL